MYLTFALPFKGFTPLPRYPWALAALDLILGACSTSADLTPPTLEPQFRTPENDYGADVAYASNGRVRVLFKSEGYAYGQNGYAEASDAIPSRYDGGGNSLWSRTVASASCGSDDCGCDDTALTNTRVVDTQWTRLRPRHL